MNENEKRKVLDFLELFANDEKLDHKKVRQKRKGVKK